MKKQLFLGVFFALGGCVAATPDPRIVELSRRDVVCAEGQDCNVKWSRAITWIAQNSHWKVSTQTDSLIQTMGPFDSTESAFTVTKVATGNGTYTIVFNSGCGNVFGCIPSAPELKVSFNQFIDPR